MYFTTKIADQIRVGDFILFTDEGPVYRREVAVVRHGINCQNRQMVSFSFVGYHHELNVPATEILIVAKDWNG